MLKRVCIATFLFFLHSGQINANPNALCDALKALKEKVEESDYWYDVGHCKLIEIHEMVSSGNMAGQERIALALLPLLGLFSEFASTEKCDCKEFCYRDHDLGNGRSCEFSKKRNAVLNAIDDVLEMSGCISESLTCSGETHISADSPKTF